MSVGMLLLAAAFQLHAAHADEAPVQQVEVTATALRNAVNAWIRQHSPADAIVDFDAAVVAQGHGDALGRRSNR